MQLFIPLNGSRHRGMPIFKSLDQRTELRLTQLMEEIFSESLGWAEMRSDFVFRNNVLLGQWDFSRGETGFMMDLQIDKALRTRGFSPHLDGGMEIPDMPPSLTGRRDTTVYQRDNFLVIVSMEPDLRLHNKSYDVRFGMINERVQRGYNG